MEGTILNMELSTRTKLICAAEQLLRNRGYSDFSYADLAEQVGIRKPSIHHHFPCKEDLGVEVVSNYLERFEGQLAQILLRKKTVGARLKAYSELFSGGVADGSFPLCAALAAQLSALPERMRHQTVLFFQIHLDWLEKVIDASKEAKELEKAPESKQAAMMLLTALEGGAVVAWALSRPEVVRVSFDAIVGGWSKPS